MDTFGSTLCGLCVDMGQSVLFIQTICIPLCSIIRYSYKCWRTQFPFRTHKICLHTERTYRNFKNAANSIEQKITATVHLFKHSISLFSHKTPTPGNVILDVYYFIEFLFPFFCRLFGLTCYHMVNNILFEYSFFCFIRCKTL